MGSVRVALILTFSFACNAAVVIGNKFLYQQYRFNFPFTLTCIHMIFCFFGSWAVLHYMRIDNPEWLSVRRVLRLLLPVAGLYSTNIVLGNVSLQWIPVSFMQTVKASVPAFTALLQTFALDQRLPTTVWASLIPVVGGLTLATKTEVNFDLVGFIVCLLAAALTSGYIILSARILSGVFVLDSTNMVFFMSPLALTLLLPVAVLWELPTLFRTWLPNATLGAGCVLMFSGLSALLLNLSTFLVIANTSPLTTAVAGNLKAVINIVVSVTIFRNEISFLNGLGCALTLFGVVCFNHASRYPGPLKRNILPTVAQSLTSQE